MMLIVSVSLVGVSSASFGSIAVFVDVWLVCTALVGGVSVCFACGSGVGCRSIIIACVFAGGESLLAACGCAGVGSGGVGGGGMFVGVNGFVLRGALGSRSVFRANTVGCRGAYCGRGASRSLNGCCSKMLGTRSCLMQYSMKS